MEQSSFFNAELIDGKYDREYNATDWANYFATFIGNGVISIPNTNLQVQASSGMNVIVNPGGAMINGYRYLNTTSLTVPINEANSTYDRITSIILELNLNNRNILCKTIDGTAEPNPQPPLLTRTDSVYQLQLATVYIAAGATNCGTITDTRNNEQVCGWLYLKIPTIPLKVIQNCTIENVTLNDNISNNATINNGTYNNPTFEGNVTSNGSFTASGGLIIGNIGGELAFTNSENATIIAYTVTNGNFQLVNQNTFNNVYSITPVETGNDTINLTANVNFGNGYTVNNPNITGTCNINNGLFNNGTAICNASTINLENMHIQDNVTGTIHVEYWALNAGLLSANANGLVCGIIKATVTLDQSCTWTNQHPIYLNVEGFPTANAMTVTYSKNFVIGSGQNVIVLNGNNAYLNANQAYTEYALVYG